MARIIEFIAPVEAIRGNMSGRQDLRYAENDNKAFEAPVGRTNYARNYTPRYIGAKVASTGKKYFTVKTKTATKINARTLKTMALLGGAGDIFAHMLKRKDLQPYIQMDRLYQYSVSVAGYNGTFRKFVMDFLRRGLVDHVQNFVAQAASIQVAFKNPWYDGTMTDGASTTNLYKFWEQLHDGGIKFFVDGRTGYATANDDFDDVIASNVNVLSLAKDNDNVTMEVSGINYYLLDATNAYVKGNDEVSANATYTLTDVAPE